MAISNERNKIIMSRVMKFMPIGWHVAGLGCPESRDEFQSFPSPQQSLEISLHDWHCLYDQEHVRVCCETGDASDLPEALVTPGRFGCRVTREMVLDAMPHISEMTKWTNQHAEARRKAKDGI